MMAERVETLVKIKDAEEESEKRTTAAKTKAEQIVEAAKKEVAEIMNEAEQNADANYVSFIEKAKKDAKKRRDSMIAEAKGKAKGIKSLDKDSVVKLFVRLIGKEFNA